MERHVGLRSDQDKIREWQRGRTAIKRTTSKKRRFDAELERMRPLVEARSVGACETNRHFDCLARADVIHHIRGRKRADSNYLENLLHVCDSCHRYIHAHSTEAYEMGWLIRKEGTK